MINKAAVCGRTQIIAVHTNEFAQGTGAVLVLKLDCIIEPGNITGLVDFESTQQCSRSLTFNRIIY
jgi:hypothetical protein